MCLFSSGEKYSPGNGGEAIARNLSHSLWLVVAILFMGSAIRGADAEDLQPRRSKPVSAAASLEGQQIFASSCAACHGLDGRGSERAPNIAGNRGVQRLSDAGITRLIAEGVPGTGMPAFRSLGASGIKSVVSHLRILQGRSGTVTLPGDAQPGKSAFFGPAGCSQCHMVGGQGGFLAADLSGYARARPVNEIRDAITNPSANQNAGERAVVAITRRGEKYSGVARNEDNFSLQIQAADGNFHFLMKSDLERFEYQPQSLMPQNYLSTLSRRELDDLVSFLISSGRASKSEPESGDED